MFNIIKPPSIFNGTGTKKIKGTVVLMKKNVLDFNDVRNGIIDPLNELLGQRVSLQLISAVNTHIGSSYFLLIYLQFVFCSNYFLLTYL